MTRLFLFFLCSILFSQNILALDFLQSAATELTNSVDSIRLVEFKEMIKNFRIIYLNQSSNQSHHNIVLEVRIPINKIPQIQGDKNPFAILKQLEAHHRTQIQDRLAADGLSYTQPLFSYDPDSKELVYRRPQKSTTSSSAGIDLVRRELAGLIASAQRYGIYDHDTLLSQLSGIEISEIVKLREAAYFARTNQKPLLVSFIFAEYERQARDSATSPQKTVAAGDSWSVLINPSIEGIRPLHLPSDSIVWHRFSHQASSLLGGYNPALANAKLSLMIENKWVEYLFWEKYAPGAMAKTEILSGLFSSRPDPGDAQSRLNSQFPEGWVLKGAFDWATGPMVLTNSTDLATAVDQYKTGTFDAHLASLNADRYKMDPDDYVEALQKHNDYKGYRAQRLLKRYERTIVQSRINIKSEYRVEVINGQVVGGNSTVERYAYVDENPKTFWDKQPTRITTDPEALRAKKQVEIFAQNIMSRLPSELRMLSAAMDIAITKEGRLYLIEANAGGNSGYLSFRAASRRAVEKKLLDDFAKSDRPGEQGLRVSEQVRFIDRFLNENKINVTEHYPDFDWTPKGLHLKTLESVRLNQPARQECKALFLKMTSK